MDRPSREDPRARRKGLAGLMPVLGEDRRDGLRDARVPARGRSGAGWSAGCRGPQVPMLRPVALLPKPPREVTVVFVIGGLPTVVGGRLNWLGDSWVRPVLPE
ncbi:hypothetical protein C8J28_11131 [Cereibacter azotoformans]|uniref:Uncharacterized protein n=1 Tax=Cereibacter azotoformans TaxID=43057 RepID=A0A2T5K5N5_9RHOB|nr:hypothetical protein C8J28_11131 [Cereibacter azotoformans]